MALIVKWNTREKHIVNSQVHNRDLYVVTASVNT